MPDSASTAAGRRVLITGLAGRLAGQLAQELEEDERVAFVVGADVREPDHNLARTEFVRADLRSPMIARVLASAQIDTVVHLSLTAAPADAGGRARMKDHNVIGTMQLLAAARKAPRLRKVVSKSTTAVYGSSYADPALFGEDTTPGFAPRSGYAKDAVEAESYARGLGHRRPDVTVTILRFANFVGPSVTTPLTRYFALPVVPTVLGYDPRLQLCHEVDAVEILRRACVEEHPGIYNAAGPGILYLSQAIRLAGKPSVAVPTPLVESLAALVRRIGALDFPSDQLRYLLYGRVGDITRLQTRFGYEPRYSTREAFGAFLHDRVVPLVDAPTVHRWEQRLRGVLTGGPAGAGAAEGRPDA